MKDKTLKQEIEEARIPVLIGVEILNEIEKESGKRKQLSRLRNNKNAYNIDYMKNNEENNQKGDK